MFRFVSIKSVGFAAACAVSASLVPAAAAEILRVPSSCAQFWGYGYGAGYHAPKVRAVRPCPPHVQRRVVVPTYPHCQGALPAVPCAPVEPLPAEAEPQGEEVPAIPTVAPVPTEAAAPLEEIPAMPHVAPLSAEPAAPLEEFSAATTERALLTEPVSAIELDETTSSLAPVLPPPSMMAAPTIDPLFNPPLPIPH